MDDQEVVGRKPGGAGDLPDGLESVSPESTAGSPEPKEADKNEEYIENSNTEEPVSNDVAGAEEPVSNDVAITQEPISNDVAISQEPVSNDIASNEESNENIESNNKDGDGKEKEDESKTMEQSGDIVENNLDEVDNKQEDETKAEKEHEDNVEKNQEEVEAMEVDETVTEPKQNGPEQVPDERESVEEEKSKPSSPSPQEDEKMDVDEPSVNNEAEKSTVDDADKKTTEDDADKQTTEDDADKQITEDDADKQTTEDDADKQITEDDADKQITEDDADKQTTEDDADKQITEDDADKQITEDDADKQITEDDADKQITEDDADKQTTEDDADKQTAMDNEDIENPAFENVPDNVETSRNDSQTIDPFDALLQGDPITEEKSSLFSQVESTTNDLNNEYDSDDHHDATDMDTTAADDTNELSLADEANVADVTEGQGADEEVCLIPDTEREISEAEKLKALANKPDSTQTSTTQHTDDSEKEDDVPLTVMKGEINTDENGEVQESSVTDINSLHEDVDLGEDDGPDYADKDREDGEAEVEPEPVPETLSDNIIQEIASCEQTCLQCSSTAVSCIYRLVIESESKYLCGSECLSQFQAVNPDKYTVSVRKIFIKEIAPANNACVKCGEEKDCYYKVTNDDNVFICGEVCLKGYMGDETDKHIVTKKRKFLQEVNEVDGTCYVCSEEKKCSYEMHIEGKLQRVCLTSCASKLQYDSPGIYRIRKKKVIKVKPQAPLMRLKVISNATDKYLDERHKMVAKTPEQVAAARADRDRSFLRTCAQCHAPYLGNDKNLSWETMDFCNESCLGKYQNIHGSNCANCKNEVSITSLGKYCVRFGYDIRQFCCSGCLEEFKKGLKICCYCQRDISTGFEGFLAPVGDKGQFKDFCSQFCVEKFDQMSKNPVPPPVWARCAVCSKEKLTQLEVSVENKSSLRLCSEPCFAAFKFVNHIFPDQCRWCNKYFERKSAEAYTIYTDNATHCFCCKACMNVYISNSRHIVPCNWCKVKKYNFDMIKRTLDNGQSIMMCSLNCLTLYQVSITAVSSRRIKCDQCKRTSQAQYHLTMSDATVRNFCTYQCVMSFQGQYSKTPLMVGSGDTGPKQAVPTGAPRRTLNTTANSRSGAKPPNMKIIDSRSTGGLPVIASVKSLASAPVTTPSRPKRGAKVPPLVESSPPPPVVPPKPPTPPPPPPPKIYNHVIIKPAPPKEVKNVSTLTKPIMVSKGLTCKPNMVSKEIQTDSHLERRILIPIPVPMYVPSPVPMFSMPFPVPVPIPLPIPIPVFIPTTRNTANGIMKEIKKIHEKMPTDPFEAELLMMAEMVAGDKKKIESDSESEEDAPADDGFSPDPMDTNNSAFGEDVLQMALKMATDYEEPAMDLESAMTASTITPSSHPIGGLDDAALHHHQMMLLEQQRAAAAAASGGMARKRGRAPAVPSPAPQPQVQPRAKRSRRSEPTTPVAPPQPEPVREPVEKPDANMCLKYTFGVNAWKQWVVTKNQEIEKSSVRRKPFKSEILQLTADELNYSLCLFVKEVRKPNGSEYAPDTIYYLVLGIQQYLFENGRIDNIFTDSYYEKFTDCLDEVARKFSVLYNDSQYIVTRVEEEHLWECKQLGAHSPHVLLSTLMFFNTKHFNLVTPEEHMQLSFSHIMKHWKRNPNQPGAAKIPGSRNVLLRFYPPQSALEANSRKKKVYEQQENEENPLRCPVKLYEFYLSKCPESVKTRNDVFYLMPERSCVPDSPVWYSTQALGKEPLSKMLHRVKMVKEINIALLTS